MINFFRNTVATVATTLKRKSVSGRSLKIFQHFKNSPNQISGQQDRFLTRRATELVEYFLNLSCSWTLESLLRLSVEIKQLPQGGEIQNLRMKSEVMHYFMHYFFKM
jgi:hypothetical protein